MEEQRTVVTQTDTPAADRVVVQEQAPRVVEERAPTYVRRSDPVGNSIAASSMIQTVVWAVVVIVLLIVGILVLVHLKVI